MDQFGCLIICFIVQNFYISLTGVIGDQRFYMGFQGENNAGEAWTLSRTNLTFTIFKFLRSIFGSYFATYIFPILTTCTIFKLIYSYWKYIPKNIFLISIFLPHYWVWQSIASKESITIPISFIIVFFLAKFLYEKISIYTFSITVILSFLFAFYRLHYAISYFWILILTILIIPILKNEDLVKIKFKNYLYVFSSIFLLLLLITFGVLKDFSSNAIINIFLKSSEYFTLFPNATTTRWDVGFLSIKDIFSNLFWGIPTSIIGFTPLEILENPKYIPSFLEGIIAISLIPIINIKLILRSKKDFKLRFSYFFIFLPSLILILCAHYPFGIFNPGATIRFKQNIVAILYFYPLFLLTFSKYNLRNLNNGK